MKGIILAGGNGTRLHPLTIGISKQLLPIYNKPMIWYPISTLMLAGIRDILIIVKAGDKDTFKRFLGNGSEFGINIEYAEQESPRGIAEAFIIGESFIGNDSVGLILGDNIFYGAGLTNLLSIETVNGAILYGYEVSDPERYGVLEESNGKIISIEEKPTNPKSNWAVTGLYFYDNSVVDIAKNIKPSNRGELEITDVNMQYVKNGKAEVRKMGRGYTWLDTGTFQSLFEASMFVHVVESRTGLKIGNLKEISEKKGWIKMH